jgi:outer membrane protein assembly factor BamD
VSLLLSSCAGGKKLEKMKLDCTERVAKSIKAYTAKKYSLSLTYFEDARTQCSGSEIMDTVLYYLGMTNLKTKKYLEARTEFQRLVQDYPGSVFFDEAKFRICHAVYKQSHPESRDQTETREAIRLLDNYLESYPKSAYADSAVFYRNEAFEKLARKEFNNANFYVKVNEPEAAVVYFRTFLGEYPDSRLVDQARYNLMVLLRKLDRDSEAREVYDEFVARSKNKQLLKDAKALFATEKKAVNGKK